jgi:acyl carrier protein
MHPFVRLSAIVAAEIGGACELGPDTLAADVAGWDSGAMVNILFAVEDAFGVVFTSAEMDRVRGLGDLLEILESKGVAETA